MAQETYDQDILQGFSLEESQALQGFNRNDMSSLGGIWGRLGNCNPNCDPVPCGPPEPVFSSTRSVDYSPKTWLRNMSRKMKYEIVTSANGNIPPQFVFHFLAQLICPGADDDKSSSGGAGAPKKSDWTKVTVQRNVGDGKTKEDMSECDRRDLVHMLNEAAVDPDVLMEDFQCLLNSEGTKMDHLCLYHLYNMTMEFSLTEKDITAGTSPKEVDGKEIFDWFIHYYICKIACAMIDDQNCSVSSVQNFFNKATTQFGFS